MLNNTALRSHENRSETVWSFSSNLEFFLLKENTNQGDNTNGEFDFRFKLHVKHMMVISLFEIVFLYVMMYS